MKKKNLIVLALVAVLCGIVTACGNSSSSTDSSRSTNTGTEQLRPIKIGMYTYLTGDNAVLGQAQYNGAKIAIEQINAAGGVNGHPLELIVYDDKSSTEMDVQNVTRLVQVDKVDAICSNGLSASLLATVQITEPQKIIQVLVSPSEKTTGLSPYVFRTFATYDTLNMQNVENMVDLGVEKVGLIYANTETGISSAEIFEKMIQDAGIDITKEAYTYGDTDFTSQFAKMYANDATTIFVNMNTNEQGLAFQQIRRLGHDELLFANEGACAPVVREVGGDAANDVVFSTVNAIPDTIEEAQSEIEKRFLTDYFNAFDELPQSDLAYRGYDQIICFAEAFRNVEDIDDKEAVRDSFANINGLEGVQGVYDFREDNGDGLGVVKAMAILDGKLVSLRAYSESKGI